MRQKWLHISLLIFQAIWFNVIVPGHQRGIVQLPGTAGRACEPSETCSACVVDRAATTKDGKSKPPTDPARNCAICFFAAHLSLPPVIDWSLPPLGLLHQSAIPATRDLIARAVLVPFDGRGPPGRA